MALNGGEYARAWQNGVRPSMWGWLVARVGWRLSWHYSWLLVAWSVQVWAYMAGVVAGCGGNGWRVMVKNVKVSPFRVWGRKIKPSRQLKAQAVAIWPCMAQVTVDSGGL